MAYFKITEPQKEEKWIKEVNLKDGTLEFTEKLDNRCHYKDDGFYADAEVGFLKFHFREKYPEIEYVTQESRWI